MVESLLFQSINNCAQKVLTHFENEVYLSSLFETEQKLKTKQHQEELGSNWVLSSAGRASPLQGEGRGFDPLSTHQINRQ